MDGLSDGKGDENLDSFIRAKAQQNGVSARVARKAVKKLRNGGMAQVVPELENAFSSLNVNATPAEKLQAKLREMRGKRRNAVSKTQAYEAMKEKVHKEQEQEAAEKEAKRVAKLSKERNHRKRLRELEKELGTITLETYNECMTRLQEDTYKDVGMRNRDRNITELYEQQQNFADEVTMEALDNI